LEETATDIADISDIENRAKADILLDAEAPIVDRGGTEIALDGGDSGRADAEGTGEEIGDSGIERLPSDGVGREFAVDEHLIVVEAIVEDPDATTNGGFSIAKDVPGEADTGCCLNAGGVLDALVIDFHALERGDAGGELPDGSGGKFLTGDGVPTDAGAGGVAEGLDELGLFRAIVAGQIEGRELVAGAPGGLDEVEANSGINGKAARYLPGVSRDEMPSRVRLMVPARLPLMVMPPRLFQPGALRLAVSMTPEMSLTRPR